MFSHILFKECLPTVQPLSEKQMLDLFGSLESRKVCRIRGRFALAFLEMVVWLSAKKSGKNHLAQKEV